MNEFILEPFLLMAYGAGFCLTKAIVLLNEMFNLILASDRMFLTEDDL